MYFLYALLFSSLLFLSSCSGDNTTQTPFLDITSVSLDANNSSSYYPTQKATPLSASVNFDDTSSQNASTSLLWSSSNSSMLSVVDGSVDIFKNGGDINVTVTKGTLSDTKSIHIHTLTAFRLVSPTISTAGTYSFSATGDFNNNASNLSITKNILWSVNNGATLALNSSTGVADITLQSGDTNITITMFNETNSSATLGAQTTTIHIP